MTETITFGIVVFDAFETLDVFGPVQIWGHLPGARIAFVSQDAGPVRSSQGVTVMVDHAFGDAPPFDVLMVPGGRGTRALVDDSRLLDFLRACDRASRWTTSVCTGAALLARAGLLTDRRATTNKQAFDWVRERDGSVDWQRQARWVQDGKYLTSSGVSAGTDMALGLVELLSDRETAEDIAREAEYVWNRDPTNDPFAVPTP